MGQSPSSLQAALSSPTLPSGSSSAATQQASVPGGAPDPSPSSNDPADADAPETTVNGTSTDPTNHHTSHQLPVRCNTTTIDGTSSKPSIPPTSNATTDPSGVHSEHQRQHSLHHLETLTLLSALKTSAFYGDVHYESSIEGDVLLPLDKVVAKGGAGWCNVAFAEIEGKGWAEEDGCGGEDDGGVGAEIESALGGWLRGDVIAALKITLANHLSFLAAETRSPTRQQNWAERRGFAIVVGHLGGIYRLNYLLFLTRLPPPPTTSTISTTTHQQPKSTPPTPPHLSTYLHTTHALSSVRVDYLPLNAVNIALEQSFSHAPGETHEEFRARIEGVKGSALRDWEGDQVREAGVERRKRRAGIGGGREGGGDGNGEGDAVAV